jgi:hypothetical protein
MRRWVSRFRISIGKLSPEQAALLLSIGLVLGVFPIMGCPTILCLFAGFALRLNAPALQLLNSVTSPLQLVLLLPLERIGASLCGGVETNGTSSIGKLGLAAIHASAGWACICLPLGVLLYFLLVCAMRKRRQLWCNGVESPA